MKFSFTFYILLTTCFVTFSEEKTSIVMYALEGMEKAHAIKLQNVAFQAFSKKERLLIIDRTNVSTDSEIRKTEALQKEAKKNGADFILTGTLNNIGTSTTLFKENKKSDEITKFAAFINFSLMLTDIKTNAVKSTKVFSLQTNNESLANLLSPSSGYYGNMEIALNKIIEISQAHISSWINSVFPVKMQIIKTEETDNNGITTIVLIKGGADMDLQKGSELYVSKAQSYKIAEGELTGPSKIGLLKVMNVLGEFSTCKVKAGAVEIDKFIKNGTILTLNIKSYK